MKDIAEKLKQLRIKNGLSQERLAEQLCVSRQAVSKWETGEALPDMENMIALARLYNTSLDELAGIVVNKEESREESEPSFEENEANDEGATINADISKDGDRVHISLNGINIRVNDGGKNINLNGDFDEDDFEDFEDLEDTIEDLEDGENVNIKIGDEGIRIGNKIKIDSDGINIGDGKVKIGSAGIIIDDDDDEKPRSGLVRILRAVPYPVITAVAYLLLGFLADAWGIAWILFCTIPVYYGLIECIRSGKISRFPYVTLMPCIYLYIGMQYSLWHPGWIIFCTTPIFYPVAGAIDKAIAKHKKSKN
jgi:transcriptional regulator with XRE-family HTH domain